MEWHQEVAAEETVIAMTSDNAEVQDTVRRVVRMIFGGSSATQKRESAAREARRGSRDKANR